MPRLNTEMGEVIVYDGDNAAELATAVGLEDVPQPDEDSRLELLVPFPIGGAELVTLAPGDGLVVRPLGFLPAPADQVQSWKLVKA